MRGPTVLAALLVGALLLSGCSSKSDTSSSSSTSGTPTGGTATTGSTNTMTTTTQAPNQPPLVMLSVTNATGAATNVTLVRGSLTFDATGSRDADSDGLSAVAISVRDANRTYPPGVLFANGQFTTVTYTFDQPGPVNVTVSGIDVRGDLTTLATKVYVNQRINVTSQTINVPSSGGAPSSATDCAGPGTTQAGSGASVVDASFYDRQPFNVVKGVQAIEAFYISGSGQFAICAPDGTAVSEAGTSTTPAKTSGEVAAPTGIQTYSIGFVGGAPQDKIAVYVIVHYEPQA